MGIKIHTREADAIQGFNIVLISSLMFVQMCFVSVVCEWDRMNTTYMNDVSYHDTDFHLTPAC